MNFFTSIFKNRFFNVVILTTGFLFIFIIADRSIFFASRSYIKNWYISKYSKTIENSLKKSSPAKIIVMGTSRSRCAFNPQLFRKLEKSKVRLQAAAGRNIKYHYYFYKIYRKYFPPPNLVIYGCDYFMFNAISRAYELISLGVPYDFSKFMDYKKVRNRASKLLSAISYLYRGKRDFDNFIVNLNNYLNRIFKEDAEWEIETGSLSGGRRIRKGLKFNYIKYPGFEGQYLFKLLSLLQRDNVKVLFLTLPDYIGTYNSQLEKDIFIKDIKKIISDFKNTSFFNFNDPGKFDLRNPKYFLNGGAGKISSHMNLFGANRFTMMIHKLIHKKKIL